MSEGDGAAGSVYYPFGLGKSAASHPQNYVRISNVENTLDPSYRMTRVGEVMLNNVTYRCRYVPEAAFVGVTPQSGGRLPFYHLRRLQLRHRRESWAKARRSSPRG